MSLKTSRKEFKEARQKFAEANNKMKKNKMRTTGDCKNNRDEERLF